MAVPSFMAIIGELGGTFGLSHSISSAADVSAGVSFCSGNPSALSLAATTPWPIPIKRPRILFWSRQNSNVGDLALLGIKPPGSASIFTISRLRPRPCVLPSQRCFASLFQASRIASDEYFGLFVIDLPA